MSARYFAGRDVAVENGSFRKVNYGPPAWMRGIACYINGDCVGTVTLEDAAECDAHAQGFKLSGCLLDEGGDS